MTDGKPIIIFTTFWDAEKILGSKVIVNQDNELINLEFDEYNSPSNYQVSSIALMHPDLNTMPLIKKQFDPFFTIKCLCPTYDILMKYKADKDWDSYTKEFKRIIIGRKTDIINWVDSLIPNKVYILCCWENTERGAKCHREILYRLLTQSKTMKDKAVYVYRSGSKCYYSKEETRNFSNLI
jgi:hypothetical protein